MICISSRSARPLAGLSCASGAFRPASLRATALGRPHSLFSSLGSAQGSAARAAPHGRPHMLRARRQLCTKPPTPAPAGASAGSVPAPAAGWSYGAFAVANPKVNNLLIATLKTGAADLVAQCVIERKPLTEVDWQRNLVFCLFGTAYLGVFQYWYQVNVFCRLFPNINKFTSQPWSAKLTDVPGLISLLGQTALDMGVLTFIYLPTFYVFKASVFSSGWDVQQWGQSGVRSYWTNWNKDVYDLFRVWVPADLICFSVALYLRLPVRHIVSFVWTAYLSFVRGSK